ncbi:DUF397 domain-containing protein [Streptomyces sp. NPDC054904]|uniref:DUF397 domain-containing protein n=1 Tax=Streptomyces sp. NPDC090054 TaxID=3365933 RepID=UPI00380D7E75
MDIQWEKSLYSTDAEGSNCLEVAEGEGDDEILLRESDDPAVVIRTTRAKLQAFLDGARAGQFDKYGTGV